MSVPTTAISPARLAANRANALRSTGPRSDEGKAKSRLNGLTHGLRAELPILPGEDPQALQDRLDAWTAEAAPEGEIERHLVATAVQASWRMDRCRAVETAALTQQTLGAEDAYDDRKAEEVERLAARLADDPTGTVRQLRQSSRGCQWLIDGWLGLAARLTSWMSFEPTQRRHAIHLLGRRPRDLFTDPIVHQWTVMYLASLLGTAEAAAEQAAGILQHDRPEEMKPGEFARLIQVAIAALPAREQAHATLKEYVAQAIAALTERLEFLLEREERDRALAVGRAAFDESPAGAARLRYEMAHQRVLRGALRDLRSEQERRLGREESAGSKPPTTVTTLATTGPVAGTTSGGTVDRAGAPRPGAPTEPKAGTATARPASPRADAVAGAPTEPTVPGVVGGSRVVSGGVPDVRAA